MGARIPRKGRMKRVDFPAVYLLHGTGGSPNGSVLQLETELRVCAPNQIYVRPFMPHSDPTVAPSVSVSHLRELVVPQGALIIGISLGGLVAAKLQETGRADMHVICINSPTWARDVELKHRMNHRVSLYCSGDEVIAGRTEKWPQLAEAYDLPWLFDHNTDPHKHRLVSILNAYLETGKVSLASDGLHDN
jgi:pimeloyl-ACP methyl ester carboxylesterase